MKTKLAMALMTVVAALSLGGCAARVYGPGPYYRGYVPGHYNVGPHGGSYWVPGHYR